jgi:hypothetical protein
MLAKRLVVPKTRKEKPAGKVQSQHTGYSTRLRPTVILPATGSFLYSPAGVEGRVATGPSARCGGTLQGIARFGIHRPS